MRTIANIPKLHKMQYGQSFKRKYPVKKQDIFAGSRLELPSAAADMNLIR